MMSDQTPMVRQYLALKENYKDCLLFFRLGDFYELFYEDAYQASRALDIVLTRRGKEEGAMPMCGIPFHSCDAYIARLIRQGFKIAICEQLETPEEAKKRGHKAIVKRDVVRVITPGTLLEDQFLGSDPNNFLLAIGHEGQTVGLSWVDISTGIFCTEEVSIQTVSSSLVRMAPKEILVCDDAFVHEELSECFRSYSHIITRQNASCFDYDNAYKRLCSFFGTTTLSSFGDFGRAEISSAGCILNYLFLTQKDVLPRLNRPEKMRAQDFLFLDAATRKSLEIHSTTTGDFKNSFFSMIDQTLTALGRRLLAHRLAFPFLSIPLIEKSLDQVGWILSHKEFQKATQLLLKECPDGERVFSRIASQRGGPKDLLAIKNLLTLGGALLRLVAEHKAPFEVSDSCWQGLEPIKNILDKALEPVAPLLVREGGFIRWGYSEALDAARTFQKDSQKTIAALEARSIQETGISTLKVKYNHIIGYYIDITLTHKDKVPASFIHRQTLVSSMRFSTPELMALQEKILLSSEEALKLEASIFQTLVEEVLKQGGAFLKLIRLIAELDLLSGFAQLSEMYRYTRPCLTEDPILFVKKGRHPTVEMILQKQNQIFIGNDCSMDKETRFILLTGPNMAGKSTYLRQNALIILLAQMGCYVPAEEAHIGIVDRLFSRVGAADDLTKGQSTFMVEMMETGVILNQSTRRSFVILDEIGRGTATYDGLSIAQAAAEYLHDVTSCRTIFATHYHEMTTLESSLPHLKCYTVAIKEWQETIIFLHTIIQGTASRSYGIHVAALAGLPPSVVVRAEALLKMFENKKEGQTLATPFLEAISERSQENLKALESLRAIDLDTLSPKEALLKLYQLKEECHEPCKTA